MKGRLDLNVLMNRVNKLVDKIREIKRMEMKHKIVL